MSIKSVKPSDDSNKFHKIEEQLYLGDIESAQDLEALKEENIKIIITVMEKDIPVRAPGVTYHHFRLMDDPFEDILTLIPETNRIISEGQSSGQNVLVHCSEGVSQSASIVIAFLMSKHKKPYKKMRKSVERIRKKIRPNSGFEKQLILYEEIRFTIEANNKKLRQHLIQTILFNTNIHNSIDTYFQKMAQLERVSQTPISLGSPFICQKCGFILCHEINVIKKFDKSTTKSCSGIYVEAQDWMRERIFDLFGSQQKITSSKLMVGCPACKEIVVNFQKEFKSYKCDCDQHRQLKCLYFILRNDKFKTE